MASNRRRGFQSTFDARTPRSVSASAGRSQSLSRLTAADMTLDQLEPRQMLSFSAAEVGPATMPAGAAVVEWGSARVAAVTNSYIVTFDRLLGKEGAVEATRQLTQRLGVQADSIKAIGRGGFASFTAEGVTFAAVRQVLNSANSMIVGIEPNSLYRTEAVPNDPLYPQEWQLSNTGQDVQGVTGTVGADISAEAAWDTAVGSRSVIIGVIDTGVQVNHPDLAANIWRNPGEIVGNGIDDDGNGYIDDITGYDFGELDNNPDDTQGHGTAVAGTIGAVGNNGVGVTGVAWNVSILPLKIATATGGLTLEAIVASHDYVTDLRNRGINVVATNNSYGAFAPAFYADQPGPVAERQAIQRYIDSGGIFVAAAGNDGADNDSTTRAYPASYNLPGIISVAATDNQDQLAGFSNYGVQNVDLAAPGVNVRTTAINSSYTYISGTSFASPMVAGAVAILKTVKPTASAFDIRQVLIDSSDQLPALQNRVTSGGRINLARAIEILSVEGPILRAINPGPVTTQNDPALVHPNAAVAFSFNKAIDGSLLSTSGITMTGAGSDGVFGNGDDFSVPISSVTLSGTDSTVVNVGLNLSSFALNRLPISKYRFVLQQGNFKDTTGNFLNGNLSGGVAETQDFEIVAASGENEPNDTLGTATRVNFNTSGQATFNGITLGNGAFAGLDVDVYRIDMTSAGQISAEVTAKRLSAGSSLDSWVRVFNNRGEQIAFNDNYYGNDSYVDVFVNTGGAYYVAVSGYGNANYTPTVAGSGSTQSNGEYNILISVVRSASDQLTGNSTFTTAKPIPPAGTQGTTTDSIVITDTRLILDVNVRINITHTFTSDLQVSLIAPDNTEILLVNRRGADGDNFTATLLDDEALTAISAGTAPFAGSYRPDNALAGFDGKSAAGTWTLRIVDTLANNVGTLNSWSIDFTLANDIFGPFESNETIPTAKSLQGINGTGSATVNASIGDGGFGQRDRDIFKFVAVQGSTLTANVTSGGSLNSALRLLDEQGREIRLSNPENSLNSGIFGYVFSTAGTYYLAVIDSNLIGFNPLIAGNGNLSTTTGSYTLSVGLSAGVSDSSLSVNGTYLSAGMSTGGLFLGPTSPGATTNRGLSYNGTEFLFGNVTGNTAERSFFGLTASGNSFRNSSNTGGVTTELPFSLTDQSDSQNRRVSAKGNFRQLSVEKTFSYGVNDKFIAVDVFLVNTGTTALIETAWMEAMNPDMGLNFLDIASTSTRNDVDGRYVSANVRNNTYQQGLTIAMGTANIDTRARATVVSNLEAAGIRDAQQLIALAQNDPNGASSDSYMALTFDLGTIEAGAKASFRYFIFFGDTPAEAAATFNTLNQGTGTGHLTINTAAPASELLSNGTSVPQLPYQLYYPEGFANRFIYEFIPVFNASDQPNRVLLIARFGAGQGLTDAQRDLVLGDTTIQPGARGGFTVNTPTSGLRLIGADGNGNGGTYAGKSYALELRSERPITATFSHYDTFGRSPDSENKPTIGEPFSSRVSDNWTFGQIFKGEGVRDYLVWYNPTSQNIKVSVEIYSQTTGLVTATPLTYDLNAYRRGGISIPTLDLNQDPNVTNLLADGTYGVRVTAQRPIVVAVSHYIDNLSAAEGYGGTPGNGATSGVLPDGQFGVNGTSETIGILNTNSSAATVTLSFIFANGSTYRHSVTVGARSQATVDVGSLVDFPSGQPYSTLFNSTLPVAVDQLSLAFNQALASGPATNAYTLWGFGEGFRPRDGGSHPGVKEYLRLYNPNPGTEVVEVTLGFDRGLGSETFRFNVESRQILEIDVHTLVTGSRRSVNAYYGLTVKAANPVVAYFGHYDSFFPGAFGSLGTSFGRTSIVS
ncbi:MAG: S8 family serine peptidase [Planctomycetes bacterium]|nr:S8 family serine peptidase [Planctomycetota bacterium]